MSHSDIYVKDPIKNVQRVQNMLLISQKTDALLQLIGPNKENYTQKKLVLKSVIEIIQNVLPTALVIPYGSFVSKCYLINSDIDFCCWTPGQNIIQSSHIVQAALSKTKDIQKVQLIDADVPVVKCTLNGIGIDVSFSQPSGILTAYFIELVDNIIKKDHLYKRTLVLAQNYFLNEMHILGSHNFMLSSYGLRTMVAFVLLNQTDIVSPFQALYIMLTYFKNFDFQNKVITIFGICEASKFEGNKNAFNVIQALQQQYLEKSINKENAQHFIDKINHLISCRMTMDEKTMREKGYLNILNSKDSDQVQHQLKQSLNIIKQDQSITLDQKDQQMQIVISEFIQRLNPIDICDDQSFFTKYVNISDPLMPSNNIGKSVSIQSMNRMQRCIAEGQQQMENLLHMAVIDACDSIPEICAEFDFIFLNTLSMILQSKHELDFHVCQKNLCDSMYKIIGKVFGMPIKGLVYQLESEDEEQTSDSSILE